MHSKGHFGLALGVMSIMVMPFGFGNDYLIYLIILLSAGLSSLPDIDLKLEIAHRKFTHNILFALFIGLLLGIMFGYASGLWYGLVGFVGGFMGVMLHLLGDVMTHMEFKPLYPLSNRKVAWHWFLAKSKPANDGFFIFGIIAFFLYILVSSGALASLLS